jgi:uncharacterized membrane protein
MKIARSALAILFGFGVFFAIVQMLSAFAGSLAAGSLPTASFTGNAPANYLVLGVVWTIAAAVVAGYVTARIAGAHEFPHAAAVGMLMIVMSFLSMRQEGASTPGWYQIAIAGCGPISAMIGVAIRLLGKPKGQTANANTSGAASRR